MADATMRKVPGALWVALATVAVITLLQVYAGIARGAPIAFIGGAIYAAILLGLYLGHKLAYVLTFLYAALVVLLGFALRGTAAGLYILEIHCLVLVPVLACTRYYFPPPGGESSGEYVDLPDSSNEEEQ